jgi:predicted DNA-binding protein YlxM (UPF0122 family)
MPRKIGSDSYAPAARLLEVRAALGSAEDLSAHDIAERFGVSLRTAMRYIDAIRKAVEHLVNIDDEGELTREATIRSCRIVRTEGNGSVSREVEHYNLEAILSVGFRVRRHRGTQFRISRSSSSRRCRTRCTGPRAGTPPPRSSTSAPTARSPSWACRRRGREAWSAMRSAASGDGTTHAQISTWSAGSNISLLRSSLGYPKGLAITRVSPMT